MAQFQPSVVVVGGGLAGLTAALTARRAGADVTLLERSSGLGGRSATTERDGFLFNIGPHALYPRAEAMLADLGVAVSGQHPPLGRTVAWRDGKRYRLPLSGVGFLSTGLLSVRDKIEAGRVFAGLGRLNTDALQSMTTRQWLDEQIKSPRVRGLFEAVMRVASYANGPEIASAGAHLEQLREGARAPVRYIDGGWQTIADGLRTRAVEAGAQIRSGARADRAWRDATGWRVRLASGAELHADAIVLAVPPRDARDLVDGAAHASLARWAAGAVPVQAATLDVALSSTPKPRQNYSIGIDRPLYFSVHSVAARLAPGNGAVIHAAMYLPPDGPRDYAAIERELEWLLDELQPGWRDVLVHRQFLPHMNVTEAFVTAAQGGMPGRPGPEVPGADGLYVAGDWVGPTGMLSDAAIASGAAAGEIAATVRRATEAPLAV